MSKKILLNALLRSDLSAFIQKVFNTIEPGGNYMHNWHIDAIAYHLLECFRGNIKRLIITLPPRYLKSISASVAFPAWVLGKDPSRKIICASYSNDLAIKHSLDTRSVIEANWYRDCFSKTRLDNNKNTQTEFVTTKKGFRLSTSVGGTLTGRGGNLIIIDDPHKAEEAQSETKRNNVLNWFTNTLLSRLDNKQEDCIILIQQRLHENDLAGHLIETGGWVHLNLPAIAEVFQEIPLGPELNGNRKSGRILHEERESAEELEKLKATMGSYAFAAQYQQNPSPSGGGIIKWDWFRSYDRRPSKTTELMIVQSWDTASKIGEHNDYSVCTTWLYINNENYLLDVFRERLEYPALKKQVLALAQKWGANSILIEDSSAGIALIQDLRNDCHFSVIAVNAVGDKQTRMMTESPAIEAGRVFVPENVHWLADFRREMVLFPNGKFDDQVDSVSQYLYWIRLKFTRPSLPEFRVTLF